MSYYLLIKPSAKAESKGIPDKEKTRIRNGIESLKQNPRPKGMKKLKGKIDFFRIRIGRYRVLYTIDDPKKIICIFSILHRKEAYR